MAEQFDMETLAAAAATGKKHYKAFDDLANKLESLKGIGQFEVELKASVKGLQGEIDRKKVELASNDEKLRASYDQVAAIVAQLNATKHEMEGVQASIATQKAQLQQDLEKAQLEMVTEFSRKKVELEQSLANTKKTVDAGIATARAALIAEQRKLSEAQDAYANFKAEVARL